MLTQRWWVVAATLVTLAACAPADRPRPTALPAPTATSSLPSVSPASSSAPPGPLPRDFRLALRPVVKGLDHPTYVTAPAGDPRLFVLEQGGRLRVVVDGRLQPQPFLDLSPKVLAGGERGLLGLAFHPDYSRNGRFYVHYTADPDGDSRMEEYRVSSDPNRADPASARLLLQVEQPASQHNGGMITFGPDGNLYLGLGDGGAEPRGQDPRQLLGTILRFDPDRRDASRPYGIPADNPFADGQGGAPEVWAYGLRNPWRFDFDQDLLYLGDVGEYRFEEIDVVSARAPGLNFGWPIREGRHCYPRLKARCRSQAQGQGQGLVEPVLEYVHDGGACAVIGGFVYRGPAMPELDGRYFYSDFCGGFLKSLWYRDGAVTEHRDWTEAVGGLTLPTSFGTDAAGELYLTVNGGTVYRLVRGR